MTSTKDIGRLIATTSGVCGGRPRIAGTGVSVRQLVACYKSGLCPEEIADEYSHLTLAQVYAALAYYHANREEIESDLAQEQAEYDRLARLYGRRSGDEA
jgi:uncharacterized protein (DUF433 family)